MALANTLNKVKNNIGNQSKTTPATGKIHQGDVDVMCHLSVEPFQNFSRLEELFIMQKEPDWTVQEMLTE